MKVIFLDFDGVLNSAEYRDSVEDYYNDFIDENKLEMLAYFVRENDAKIVLTTQWRLHWNEGKKQEHPEGDRINALFSKYGMEIYSKTEYLDDNRNLEISDWLVRHDVESYVIFDDIDHSWSETNRMHFVKTDDAKDGLTYDSLHMANLILNNGKETRYMKTKYEKFKEMSLRPSYYNGTQIEVDVDFDNASLVSVGVKVANALNMIPGDTVAINGKVRGEDFEYENINVYICGDTLTDFIRRHGIAKIRGIVRAKLEQAYAVYEYKDYGSEPKVTEIIAYKLVEENIGD